MGLHFGMGFNGALVGASVSVEFSTLADGSPEVTANGATATITISGSSVSAYNGTFEITIADLASGPVNLVAPGISGTAGVGETLTRDYAGLWIYDSENPEPVITAIWQSDGSDISGETATTFDVTATEAETDVTYEETATQSGTGARSEDSNAIVIPASAGLFSTYFTEYSDGQRLDLHADFAELTPVLPQEKIYVDATKEVALLENPASPNTGGWYRLTIEAATPAADQYVAATLGQMADSAQTEYLELILRQSGTGYYILRCMQGGSSFRFRIYEADGSHALTLLWDAESWSATGFDVRFEAEGTSLRVYENDVLIHTLTGATGQTSGKAGFGMYRAAHTDDHLEVDYLEMGDI